MTAIQHLNKRFSEKAAQLKSISDMPSALQEQAQALAARFSEHYTNAKDLLQLLHETQRLLLLDAAGAATTPEILDAIKDSTSLQWKDAPELPVEDALQKRVGEQFLQAPLTKPGANILIRTQPFATKITEHLVEGLIARGENFDVAQADSDFQARVINAADPAGVERIGVYLAERADWTEKSMYVGADTGEAATPTDKEKAKITQKHLAPFANKSRSIDNFFTLTVVPTPRDAYTAALQETHPDYADLPLTIGNDANAMLAGMIDDIVHSSRADKRTALHDQDGNEIKPSTLLNRRVAMFGIGTGLGHAIVDVSKKGNMKFVTDGHASRIRLTVDTEDLPLLQKAIQIMNTGAKPEIITLPDNSVRAEDLMRAPVLRALAGVESAKEIDWANNPEHDEVVRFVGKYMGRLISVIKSGHSEDVHPENGWSEEEKQQAAGTQYYLLGGGIGSKPLGAQILRYAEEELDRLGIKDIKLVQYTRENPAPRAAAMMVPTSLYSGIERAV